MNPLNLTFINSLEKSAASENVTETPPTSRRRRRDTEYTVKPEIVVSKADNKERQVVTMVNFRFKNVNSDLLTGFPSGLRERFGEMRTNRLHDNQATKRWRRNYKRKVPNLEFDASRGLQQRRLGRHLFQSCHQHSRSDDYPKYHFR